MKSLKVLVLLFALLMISAQIVSCASNEVQTIDDPDEGSNDKYKD